MDPMPPEALLAAYPPPMQAIGQKLRAIVRRNMPDAVERVRAGWRLIGYDLPVAPKRRAYFCWIAPEAEHVHLGFQYGVFMSDPDRVLVGQGITRKVRWVTFRRGDPIEERLLVELLREAARVAVLSPAERFALVLDREEMPSAVG